MASTVLYLEYKYLYIATKGLLEVKRVVCLSHEFQAGR
jgi:hypothetical protein